MKEYEQTQNVDASPDEVFAWVSNVNNLPKYLPPIKEADTAGSSRREDAEQQVWLKGEIPDQGEFENEGYLNVDQASRRMEWGAEVYRDYSGELEVAENGNGGSAVTVRLWFGEQSVEGQIQEQSSQDRDPLEESLERTLESVRQQIEEGAGKEPPPSPQD